MRRSDQDRVSQAREVINSAGPAPLLIACDHAENALPSWLGNLGLAAQDLQTHIAFDIGAKAVSVLLSGYFNAPLICAAYSRLAIDLNRHTDDPALIPECSDSIIISGNQKLSIADRSRRIAELFQPYHIRYAELVGELQQRARRPVILSVHSFTPAMNGFHRPWQFGLLWDKDQALATALYENLAQDEKLCIGRNQPYSPHDPQGYAQVVHAEHRGVEMALIEIRQDLIADAPGQKWAAEKIFSALAPMLG